MAKVISILNHKGGVGKTTTSLNLAYYLGVSGKKVLLIDLDPQGSATSAFGIDKKMIAKSVSFAHLLLTEKPVIRAIKGTKYDNVSIVPATMDLIVTAFKMSENHLSLSKVMKNLINDIRENYDFIFFDCPPSWGTLNLSALNCSDTVIVPTQCEYFATEGLTQVTSQIRKIKKTQNRHLKFEGILLTMFDPRNKVAVEVVKDIKDTFRYGIYETIIPRNIKLVESAMHNLPIAKYSPNSKGAIAYRNLTKEFLKTNKE